MQSLRPYGELVSLVALSDDMTGAATCAGEVSRTSQNSRVALLSWRAVHEGAIDRPVSVIDTATRLESPAEAIRRMASIVDDIAGRERDGERIWYKRVDSRLRGNIIAELRLPVRTSAGFCLRFDTPQIAPAIP